MRELAEHAGTARVDTTDGLKIISSDGRWVLVIPDPAEAITHLWAEGIDTADSARLLEHWGAIAQGAIGRPSE
jgi:mannose-1-phosphate guanylyltransferase/phosphomannomutase